LDRHLEVIVVEIFEVSVTGIALACSADYLGVLRLLFSIDFAFWREH
jgi:hypothetical protein